MTTSIKLQEIIKENIDKLEEDRSSNLNWIDLYTKEVKEKTTSLERLKERNKAIDIAIDHWRKLEGANI